MADLKDFDEKGLLEAITWAARRAQESIETTAQSVLDDIRTVARAQGELPKRLDDLLAGAAGFWVNEQKIDSLSGSDGLVLRNVRVDFGNRCVHLTNPNDYQDDRDPRALPAGKRYRFILIIQEVEDVNPS